MQPTTAQINKEDSRKRRRATERFRRYIEDLRRRKMQQEHDRRRRWLITLLLALLESKPAQMFFSVHLAAPDPAPPKQQPQPPRKSEKKTPAVETISDYDRHYLFDHRPRRGEEHLEVYDGLTHEDIEALNRIHRPHLFAKFQPIPGMPSRYRDEPVHIWTLIDHIGSDYHRPDAIKALKLVVDESAHDFIDACATGVDGLTHRDLRRECRRKTPEKTIKEFPRAAEKWREAQRREAEERKREIKETPKRPKLPGVD